MEEFRAAREAVLQAERNLAAAKGEEYAVAVKFPVCWDTGAPLPYLLQNDYRTFLAVFLQDFDPDWDGTFVRVRNPNSGLSEKLALIEFERCICTKMGSERRSSSRPSITRKRTRRIRSNGGRELDLAEGA
jgi:hypothetical protein